MRKRFYAFFAVLIMVCAVCAYAPVADAAPAPEAVTLNAETLTVDLRLTKYATLSADVAPSDASQYVLWKSSDTRVAVVAYNGKITALRPGKATITCTARYTNVKTTAELTVVNTSIPESVTLDVETLDLLRFESYQLTETVTPEIATQTVTWKSSNPYIATVSSKGLVKAVNKGTATITCYSTKDTTVRGTVVVNVTKQATPKKLTITPDDTAMYVGNTLQLNVTPEPADACAFYRYALTSSYCASIDDKGLLTAKRAGSVTVYVYSRQSSYVYAKRTIRILPVGSPLYVTNAEDSITMNPGKTYPIETTVLPATAEQGLKYKSSSTFYATVNENGVITARNVGTVYITVYSAVNSNVYDKIKVKIQNLPAPTSIMVAAESNVVEKGGKLQLIASPVPATNDGQFLYYSSNVYRATVSSTGLVTGKTGGYVTITVKSKLKTSVKATYKIFVRDPLAPTAVVLPGESVVLDVSETETLEAQVMPETANQSIKWISSNTYVAQVNSSGKIIGRGAGTCTISAVSTYDSSVRGTVSVRVVNRSAPASISAELTGGGVEVGEKAKIAVSVSPATASQLFTFTSANTKIATVSSNGTVTGVKIGTTAVTVASRKRASVKVTVPVRVYSPSVPGDVTLNPTSTTLGVGDSITVKASVFPASASQQVTWKTSNAAVATVSSAGKIQAVGVGRATITCAAASGDASATCTVTVMSTEISRVIPERTTNIAGINGNLAKIEAIRRSAANELLNLNSAGVITASESAARLEIVNRAFEMQAFPWMTTSIQEYWSTAYAYKRYTPGNVYYGLPYIQCGTNGIYTNRQFNVTKAVAQGYYTASGGGYYLMSRSKFLNKMYVGCDCSSFVSMSQWGTSHTASYYNTTSIAGSPYYKNISNWSNLRPGDLLVSGGHHTILFLYFTDDARTQMMIIEQGGDGNTVICSIQQVSKYAGKGYIARRKMSFK